jgi:pimeloyl-ACP methyl ester carboxylesterase
MRSPDCPRGMKFREFGPRGGEPDVIVLHGGPGAPGSAGGLARALAEPAHVLEPWQRAMTVADHIEDMRSFIAAHCDAPPVLVGHSWGAMLALAFAAAHPSLVLAICAVCPGTFDLPSRAAFKHALIDRAYDVDLLPDDPLDWAVFDEEANARSWSDMLRLQADGTYPAAFAAIQCPVLMLHGAADPHPGPMIRDALLHFLPQLDYRELDRCGHYPWRERHARDAFVAELRDWLASLR